MENFSDITHWEMVSLNDATNLSPKGYEVSERHEFPPNMRDFRFIAPNQTMNYKTRGIVCPVISLNSNNPIKRLRDNTPITVWLYRNLERIVKYEGVIVQYDVSIYQFNMRVHTYEHRRMDKKDTEMVYIDFRKNKILKYIDIDFSKQKEDWGELPF